MTTTLTLSGTTYFAGLSHIEPKAVTQVFKGCRVTLEAPDEATRDAWVEHLTVVACDLADEGEWPTVEAIYKDVERADREAGKT